MKTLFFYLITLATFATNPIYEIIIEAGFTPGKIEFSDNNHFAVLASFASYEVWDLKKKRKVLSGVFKNDIELTFNEVNTSEGSTFMLFENEKVFLVIDYALNRANIKAYSLEDGTFLWENNDLDMSISNLETGKMLFSAFKQVQYGGVKNLSVNRQSEIATRKDFFNRLVNYIDGKNAVAINSKIGLQLIDLKDGSVLWTQPELKGGVGELVYVEENELLIAVRVPTSEEEHIIAKPEVQGIDSKTGAMLWSLKYEGSYQPNRLFVIDDTLVLNYFGLMLIDLNTGEERKGDVYERMQGQRKEMNILSKFMTEGAATGAEQSNLVFDQNGYLYYIVGLRGNGNIVPNSGRKAFLKIDVHQDKVIAEVTKVATYQNNIFQEELIDDMLIVKVKKSAANSFLQGYNTTKGTMAFKTSKLKNRLGTDTDPFTIKGNQIIDFSTKGMHFFDVKSGKENRFITYKKLDIGKLKNNIVLDDKIVLFGTKKLAVIAHDGSVIKHFDDVKKYDEYHLFNNTLYILHKDDMISLDLTNLNVTEEKKFKNKEKLIFNEDYSAMARIYKGASTVKFQFTKNQ